MKKTATMLTALALSSMLALSACAGASSSTVLTVGTTDKIIALDPAGAYDHGSLMIMVEVYQFLLGFAPGKNAPTPDAAKSCEFTQPAVYTCIMRDGLKFANGHDLTSSDVKFSFDRMVNIADETGPVSLLGNLDRVEAPDAATVHFYLKEPNDQTFPQVLATSAGPIVDEEVFSATEVTTDDVIVAANAFSGPYMITSYNKNDNLVLTPYAGYKGNLPTPSNGGIIMKTFTEATNLRMSISNGDIDVAYRSLTPTDIETLQSDPGVKVWQEPGGEIRYITFNLKIMPGDTDAQKFAIRQAIASVIDRDALSTNVYKGQYIPLCSYVPDGFVGANKAVCDAYPLDKDKAAKYLSDAGVSTPVAINLQYNPDHYGSSSDQEYGLIKQQLEATGLFTVALQSAEWVTYAKERTQDVYSVFQMGWFPDFPDADNYLTPFFGPDSFLANHFESAEYFALLTEEIGQTDAGARTKTIQALQTMMAEKYLSTLPILQGSQWAVARTNVSGVTLSVSDMLLFTTLVKK